MLVQIQSELEQLSTSSASKSSIVFHAMNMLCVLTEIVGALKPFSAKLTGKFGRDPKVSEVYTKLAFKSKLTPAQASAETMDMDRLCVIRIVTLYSSFLSTTSDSASFWLGISFRRNPSWSGDRYHSAWRTAVDQRSAVAVK